MDRSSQKDADRDREDLTVLFAYARCHERWFHLFFWLIEVIKKESPRTYRKLMEALKREGLAKDNPLLSASLNEETSPFPTQDLYSINPSHETVKRVRRLTESTSLP